MTNTADTSTTTPTPGSGTSGSGAAAPSRFRWRVVDIIVAAVIAVACGVIFLGWNIASDFVTDPLGAVLPGLKSLGYGLWLRNPEVRCDGNADARFGRVEKRRSVANIAAVVADRLNLTQLVDEQSKTIGLLADAPHLGDARAG